MHAARILADSMSPDGVRLTTMEVVFPRIVLAEFNTHRVFSRNSASSRAIPIQKMLRLVNENPYVPSEWGKNQKGMQADEPLGEDEIALAKAAWLDARDAAVERVQSLLEIGVHKQLTNRLLEPFMWHTVVVTATEWDNYFSLRCHPAAHPDIRLVSEKMEARMGDSTPLALDYNEWHLPLIFGDDWDEVQTELSKPEEILERLCKISVGRCARVSYLTHDGKRDHDKDIELYDRLFVGGHMSPFEHVARPARPTLKTSVYRPRPQTVEEAELTKPDCAYPKGTFFGNFRGWVSYRKTIPHEEDLLGHRG